MIVNIEMTAGDTKRIVIAIKDDLGDPINIANLSQATFKVAEAPMGRAIYSSTPVISKSLTDSNGHIENDSGPEGLLVVYLDPADTVNLSGQYLFEVKITEVNGDVTTVSEGMITIKENL